MFAWRLNSRVGITYHETLFTTNPTLFCEMFKNILTNIECDKQYIRNWDKLQQFNENELTTKYCFQSNETIFKIDYEQYDIDTIIYEIETIEILV